MDNIKIYFIVLSLILGFLVSSIAVNNFNFKGRKLVGFSKWAWSIFIFSSVISSTFIVKNYIRKINGSGSITKKHKPYIESDSLKKVKIEQEMAFAEKKSRDSLINYIQAYYNAYCINDLEKLDNFYTYPMYRYYTYAPASKNLVHERAKFEHNHYRYKNGCKISAEKATITRLGKDTIEVSIELSSSKNNRKFTTMRLNKEKKIFYILNTVLEPFKDSTDIKFKPKRK